jgi:uncharacterized protein (TIGR02284 family)
MLRSEAEVALNDVVEAAREAADLYADDAEVAHEASLAELFDELAQRRDRFASLLDEQIRKRGDLPDAPDTDRETFHRLGNRLRAVFSGDERRALLNDRIAAEQDLQRRVELALAQPVGLETQSQLGEFKHDIEAAQQLLQSQLMQ